MPDSDTASSILATRNAALDALLRRAHATAVEDRAGFPHFAPSDDPQWVRSVDGDWTGGFFVGQLWIDAALSQQPERIRIAHDWASRLAPRAESATIFRGFLLWYGLGIDLLPELAGDLAEIALRGARSLAADFNSVARVIPLGADAEEAHTVGDGETNIDGVPGTILLLDWAARVTGDETFRHVALAHAARHVDFCLRDDGGVIQSASFDTVSGDFKRRYTHKGFSDASIWTRAQAWGMLGFAQAARIEPSKFLEPARLAADWWLAHLPPDHVTVWDFDDPDPAAPVDTSGTAIAAAALLELAEHDPDQAQRYRSTAELMVDVLVDRYLTPLVAGSDQPPGRLLNGTYNNRIGLAINHELIWGNYFLSEALARLTRRRPSGMGGQ